MNQNRGLNLILHKKGGIIVAFLIGALIGLFFTGRPDKGYEESSSSKTVSQETQEKTGATESQAEGQTVDSDQADSQAENKLPDYMYDANIKGLTSENPATNRLEYKEALSYLVMNGIESPVTVYVNGLGAEDFKDENKYINTTFFKATKNDFDTNQGKVVSVRVSYAFNENYYAYMNVMNGDPIPEGEDRAEQIAEAVKAFLETNINDSMSDYEKEIAIYSYLDLNNTYYYDDPFSKGDHHEVYGALVNHVAVCSGYARAFYLLASCCGLECDYVSGQGNGEGHAWNMVKLDGKWYNVDVTYADTCVENCDYADYSFGFLNLTDQDMIDTGHTWDAQAYHTADSRDYNYYYLQGRLFQYDGFCQYVSENLYYGNLLECSVTDFDKNRYDIGNMIRNYGYRGAYQWYITGDNPKGYCTIYIYLY